MKISFSCLPSTAASTKHLARVAEGEAGDLDYRCACLLAELVGRRVAGLGHPTYFKTPATSDIPYRRSKTRRAARAVKR